MWMKMSNQSVTNVSAANYFHILFRTLYAVVFTFCILYAILEVETGRVPTSVSSFPGCKMMTLTVSPMLRIFLYLPLSGSSLFHGFLDTCKQVKFIVPDGCWLWVRSLAKFFSNSTSVSTKHRMVPYRHRSLPFQEKKELNLRLLVGRWPKFL